MFNAFDNASGAPLGSTAGSYSLQFLEKELGVGDSTGKKDNLVDAWSHGAGADFDSKCNTQSLIQYVHPTGSGRNLNKKLMAHGEVQEKILSRAVHNNTNFQKRFQEAIDNNQYCDQNTKDICFTRSHNDIGIGFNPVLHPDLTAAIGAANMEVLLTVRAEKNSGSWELEIEAVGQVFDTYDFNMGRTYNTEGAWVQFGYGQRNAGKIFITSVPFTVSLTTEY